MCNPARIAEIAKIAKIAKISAIPAILAFLAIPGVCAGQTLPDLPVRSLEQLSTAPRPVTQIAHAAAVSGLDGPQTLSVSVTQPTSVVTVLQLLFRGTAFNTVVHSPLRGTFSGELRNVTLRQALEAVLFPSGLGYDLRGMVIRVFPRTTTRRDSQEGRR